MKVISCNLECVNINKRLIPTKADSRSGFLDLSNLTELLLKTRLSMIDAQFLIRKISRMKESNERMFLSRFNLFIFSGH